MRFMMRVAGPAVVVALSAAGVAHAGEPEAPVRRVWLEVRPWTCMRELPSFARHVELACDAMGGECEVARSEEQSTERAILGCEDPPPWTLRLGAVDGGEALVVSLEGDREQRLRKAAMWIARARPEHVLELPVPAPAPPTPPTPPPAAEPIVFAWPAPAEPARRTARRTNRGGIALSGFGAASTGQWGAGGGGFRVELAFPLPRGFYWSHSVTYLELGDSQSLSGPGGEHRHGGVVFSGATVGWGAPFDHRWLGFALGGGAGATWGSQPPPPEWMVRLNFSRPGTSITPYGRAAITLQVPIPSSRVRPTFTLSGLQALDQLGESSQTVMLETGLAWQAW